MVCVKESIESGVAITTSPPENSSPTKKRQSCTGQRAYFQVVFDRPPPFQQYRQQVFSVPTMMPLLLMVPLQRVRAGVVGRGGGGGVLGCWSDRSGSVWFGSDMLYRFFSLLCCLSLLYYFCARSNSFFRCRCIDPILKIAQLTTVPTWHVRVCKQTTP